MSAPSSSYLAATHFKKENTAGKNVVGLLLPKDDGDDRWNSSIAAPSFGNGGFVSPPEYSTSKPALDQTTTKSPSFCDIALTSWDPLVLQSNNLPFLLLLLLLCLGMISQKRKRKAVAPCIKQTAATPGIHAPCGAQGFLTVLADRNLWMIRLLLLLLLLPQEETRRTMNLRVVSHRHHLEEDAP